MVKKIEETVVEEVKEKIKKEVTPKTWKEVFKANYEGKSEEAKQLKPFIKETYKGNDYIPWAVMERLTYMCDENAKFTVIPNRNGGQVHTDTLENHQVNIQKGETVSETRTTMFSHFVQVALEFMGKIFIESYPIQDRDYTAIKVIDQNLVNKALQRAKAKVAARGTGLALALYEGFDLQFDEVEEPKKPELTKKPVEKVEKTEKETQKVENVVEKPSETVENVKKEYPKATMSTEVKEEPKVEDTTEYDSEFNSDIRELVEIIKATDLDKMQGILQKINISVMKKYGFALSATDEEVVLADKISKFPNVEQFKKTIINLIG